MRQELTVPKHWNFSKESILISISTVSILKNLNFKELFEQLPIFNKSTRYEKKKSIKYRLRWIDKTSGTSFATISVFLKLGVATHLGVTKILKSVARKQLYWLKVIITYILRQNTQNHTQFVNCYQLFIVNSLSLSQSDHINCFNCR